MIIIKKVGRRLFSLKKKSILNRLKNPPLEEHLVLEHFILTKKIVRERLYKLQALETGLAAMQLKFQFPYQWLKIRHYETMHRVKSSALMSEEWKQWKSTTGRNGTE